MSANLEQAKEVLDNFNLEVSKYLDSHTLRDLPSYNKLKDKEIIGDLYRDDQFYYENLSKDADAIVSIHISAKASGTYNAALQGVSQAKANCEVHVVDSSSVSVGLGLVTMAAASVARAGGSLKEVLEETHRAVAQTQIRGVLDTLKYLLKGGRITRTKALLGSLLKVKPILTMRNGEITQTGVVRSYSKGVDKLLEFVKEYQNLQEAAISYSTVPEAANTLKKGIASIIDEKRIQMSRVGAALGVHGGPGTLLIALRGG